MAKASHKPATAPAPFEPDFTFLRAVADAMGKDGHLMVDPAFLTPYVNAGLVEANNQITDAAMNVATRLTEDGAQRIGFDMAGAADETEGEDVEAASGGFEIDNDVPVPTTKRTRARRGNKYPFDALQVNGSFHIPETAEKSAKELLKSFGSQLSLANLKYSTDTGRTERVTVSDYKVDGDGKRVKENGHFVKIGEKTVDRKVTTPDRAFAAYIAAPDDKRGAGIRVFRVK